ncbi:MAG: hypothetical protein RR880_03980 [Bacteroidales bacterium]
MLNISNYIDIREYVTPERLEIKAFKKIRENKIELCSVAQLYTALGKKIDTPLYKYKNAIAGYTHLYWGEFNIMNLY